MKTIRHQLLVGLLCATLACIVGAGALLYHSLLAETNELADLQLRQLASSLPDEFAPESGLPGAHDPEEAFILQAWDEHGALMHAITATGLTHLPRYEAHGYADIVVNGKPWRLYGLTHEGRYVQVAQPMAARDALAAGMALRAGAPLLVFAVIFGMLILAVVGRALRPLDRLAQSVGGQSPTALKALDPESMPPELRPVALALNALMGKFEVALGAQRTFVADAAHELRSPLTALKLQLQLVERAGSDEARTQALAKMHERLDRGSHLVQQLLSLARHESGLTTAQLQEVDLGELLETAVADHSALADSRDIDLGVEAPARVVVRADRDGLRVLLNNLVDNALRYTQRGGRVDLQSTVVDGRVLLRVRDNGPGVAPEHRERLFDRFFRPDGNEVWGCGLGLSIVRNIADHHRAEIRLEEADHGKGLSVTVLFPEPV
jgi:two-component system OmpR family sensor kinase